jgi:hypothetical protein
MRPLRLPPLSLCAPPGMHVYEWAAAGHTASPTGRLHTYPIKFTYPFICACMYGVVSAGPLGQLGRSVHLSVQARRTYIHTYMHTTYIQHTYIHTCIHTCKTLNDVTLGRIHMEAGRQAGVREAGRRGCRRARQSQRRPNSRRQRRGNREIVATGFHVFE